MLRLCIILLLFVLASQSIAAPPPNAGLIVMEGTGISIESINNVVEIAKSKNGHIYHVMPCHSTPGGEIIGAILIGTVLPGTEPDFLALPFVVRLERLSVDPSSVAALGYEAIFAVVLGIICFLVEVRIVLNLVWNLFQMMQKGR